MKLKGIAIAAAGLLALGSAQVVQAQSLADVNRAAAALEESSGQYEGMSGAWIAAIALALAAGVGLYFLLEEGDDAVSP